MFSHKLVKLFVFLSIILSTLMFSVLAHAGQSFSRLYVFGDSLSDTGNLASLIGPFPPPFYMNRVSNGPVAVDVLAQRLGLDAASSLHFLGPAQGGNYAVAGARASGDDIVDLDNQLTMFLGNHGHMAPADALYVIFIGGNDIRSALELDTSAAIARIDAAVTRVEQTIAALADSGARNILVINAPNIGLIPETRLLADEPDNAGLVKQARKLSWLYRRGLHKMTRQLKHDRALQITEFDLFSFFNRLIKTAHVYDFSNTTDACFDLESFSFHPDCESGPNFDPFIFFDDIHPTARVHALVGEALYRTVNKPAYVRPPWRHRARWPGAARF